MPQDNQPLSIALFSGNYNYVVDGPVLALNRLVGHLEKSGHNVLVFAPTIKNPPYIHTGTLIAAPSVAVPGRSEYRVAFGMSSRIRSELDQMKPDLIHVAAPDLLGRAALKYANRNKIPAVASFHTRFDTYPRYYNMAWAEGYVTNYLRRFYGRCEHVYAPSQSMIEELRDAGFGQDLRLWTRGVNPDRFNPAKRDMAWRRSLGFDDSDVVVAFVGRLVLEKGLDIFAKVVQRTPRVRALIAGEGPERKNFTTMLPGAAFTGHLDGDDLARAYASADIFFNPSVTETFGNVTLEAMASGVPSICANAAGSASLITHEETGLLTSPNVENFAAELSRLVADPDWRKRLGENARRDSLGYSWDEILDGLISNYRDAIRNYKPVG